MFGRLLRRDPHASGIASVLYGAIVAQARTPALYADFHVPDTLEGRFEMVVLHTALVVRCLGEGDQQGRAIGQEVFDLFCKDMDRSLRDLGVGDLAVPKRMRRMAEAFYGRSAAYDSALAGGRPELAAALRRIVFTGDAPGHGGGCAGSLYFRGGKSPFGGFAAVRRRAAMAPPVGIQGGGPKTMSDRPILSRQIAIASIPADEVVREVVANAAERDALAEANGLVELRSLAAEFLLTALPDGVVSVEGRVKADLIQSCVVSLVPVSQTIAEPVAVRFAPAGSRAAPAAAAAGRGGDGGSSRGGAAGTTVRADHRHRRDRRRALRRLPSIPIRGLPVHLSPIRCRRSPRRPIRRLRPSPRSARRPRAPADCRAIRHKALVSYCEACMFPVPSLRPCGKRQMAAMDCVQ